MLDPIDLGHLNFAQGWIELGNWMEANAELEEIAAPSRAHPDVLDVRWQVYALAGKWKEAVEIAGVVLRFAPEKAAVTQYNLARYACRLKKTDEATLWLGRAVEAGIEDVRLKALDDPDLAPLWADCQESLVRWAKEHRSRPQA